MLLALFSARYAGLEGCRERQGHARTRRSARAVTVGQCGGRRLVSGETRAAHGGDWQAAVRACGRAGELQRPGVCTWVGIRIFRNRRHSTTHSVSSGRYQRCVVGAVAGTVARGVPERANGTEGIVGSRNVG